MEIKAMKLKVIAFIFFLSASYSFSSDSQFEKTVAVEISKVQLQINNENNTTTLKYKSLSNSGDVPIKLSHPCYFSSDSKGEPIIVEWKKGIKVLLLEHSISIPDKPKWCKTELQGVVVYKDEIYLSDTIINVSFCPPSRHDNKIYCFYGEEFNEKILGER